MTEVYVGTGLLERLPRLMSARFPRRRATLVTDSYLAKTFAPRLSLAFKKTGWEVRVFVLPRGEAAKSLGSVFRLWSFMLKSGHERRDPLVALGGGTVGDAAGFAAATWMRGVPLVQVPTTLLAQADSCLGGKTAMNLPGAKNAVGAFHQPVLAVADVGVLRTLPEADYASGLAEVVKYGLVLDAAFARALDKRWAALQKREPKALEWAVGCSLRIKARIVSQDEHDLSGRRELLNFGHTLGHALEAASAYRVRHGEAVAFGMRAAVLLSGRLKESALIERLLARLPSPGLKGMRGRVLARLLVRDKKARGGKPVFVLLKGLARPIRTDKVSEARVLDALAALGVRP